MTVSGIRNRRYERNRVEGRLLWAQDFFGNEEDFTVYLLLRLKRELPVLTWPVTVMYRFPMPFFSIGKENNCFHSFCILKPILSFNLFLSLFLSLLFSFCHWSNGDVSPLVSSRWIEAVRFKEKRHTSDVMLYQETRPSKSINKATPLNLSSHITRKRV